MKTIIITMLLLFIVQQLWSARSTGRTETPDYTVIKTFDEVEIRNYPGLVLASTNMGAGTYSTESGNGFRTVAGYIFGSNETGEKISMTAPVMVEMNDTMPMSFIMPGGYTMENLPRPNSGKVYLHEAPSRTVAVIRYGGFSNEKRFEEHKDRLLELLNEQGIATKGPFMFFGYNPPYQLINRRNEVAVEIEWPLPGQ